MQRANNKLWIYWVWFAASSIAYCWLLLGPFGDYFKSLSVRVIFMAILVFSSVLILRVTWPGYDLLRALTASLLGFTIIYEVATFLPAINNYPFTQTWSEGSAFYFASAYFSEQIYGVFVDLPLINPSRHFLLAIPFLIEELPIGVHRLWEVLLRFLITGLSVYLLVRRLRIDDKFVRWGFFGFVFLYLFQGPVYYFLLISIIPVIWGFDGTRLNKTLILILLGSAWAGASRVNWIPVPALLAATYYFLEVKMDDRHLLRYLKAPLIWFGSGLAIGLLTWIGYAQISGQPVGNFGIYFSSNMLWYRLLPNATFPGGVFFMTLLASLPMLGIIALGLYRAGFNYHWIRHLGIASILLVLFTGGMIVSTKIGGGNNIHNLDAYLLILLVSGSYLFLNRSVPDYDFPEREPPQAVVNVLVITAVIMLVLFTLQGGRPSKLPPEEATANVLLTIQENADQTISEGGKVLFIAERQLLTFDEIKDVPLLPEYERMDLMEMVMGNNEPYLAEFRERIRNQEYALIISEPLVDRIKGRDVQFGDENDVYVREVTRPVLCYYEPVKDFQKFPIQLLKPRAEDDTCS